MRTPNEPADDFTFPPPAPKQPEPKTEIWRTADTPGFLVNEAGQLKTDLPEPLEFMRIPASVGVDLGDLIDWARAELQEICGIRGML